MIDDGERFQPSSIQLPVSLKIILSDKEAKIKDVLNQDITFRLFRSAEPTLVKFLVNHVDDLIKLAFDHEEDRESSAKAFALLEHSQPQLTAALLEKQRLHNTACIVLNRVSATNTLYLNRLASLTLNAIYSNANDFTHGCGYILQMVQMIAEPSVLSLFESMCAPSDDASIIGIQKWLVSIGFAKLLQKEINEFPLSMENCNLTNPQANYFNSLLRILTVCGSSPIIGPKVCTSSFAAALNQNAGNYPQFIENQRWEAIAAIYCPATKESMRGFFPLAMEIVKDDNKSLTRACTSAIDFLTAVTQFDPVIVDFMISMEIPRTILNLALSFPSATLLNISILDFIKEALKNDKIRSNISLELVKILNLAYHQTNKCLRYLLYKISHIIIKAATSNSKIANEFKKIPEFNTLVNEQFVLYRNILKSQYGGYIIVPDKEDINFLVDRAIHEIGAC